MRLCSSIPSPASEDILFPLYYVSPTFLDGSLHPFGTLEVILTVGQMVSKVGAPLI